MPRKTHQTTLRFSDGMWEALGHAAARRDVSVAQYVRDAAQARLDGDPEPPESEQRSKTMAEGVAYAQDRALNTAEDTAALWEQGRLARERSEALRAQSRDQFVGSGSGDDRFRTVSASAAALWEKSRLARERAQLLRDRVRDFNAERGGLAAVSRKAAAVEDAARVVRSPLQ